MVLLTGRPNREVIVDLSKCDFVIDQIYSDTLMIGFACDAASLGTASIVRGYGLEELKQFVPSEWFRKIHVPAGSRAGGYPQE